MLDLGVYKNIFSCLSGKSKNIVVLVAVMMLSASMPVLASSDLFDRGVSAAAINAQTFEGEAYEQNFGRYFVKFHSDLMQRCVKSFNTGARDGFRVVIKMSKTGKIIESAGRPESEIAGCFIDELKRDVFPLPPKAGYWLDLNVGIRQ